MRRAKAEKLVLWLAAATAVAAIVVFWSLRENQHAASVPIPASSPASESAPGPSRQGQIASPPSIPVRTTLNLTASETAETPLILRFRAKSENGEWEFGSKGRVLVLWNRTHPWGRYPLDIVGGRAKLHPKLEKEAPREWLEFEAIRLDGRRAIPIGAPTRYVPGEDLVVDCQYEQSSEIIVLNGSGGAAAIGLALAMAAGPEQWDLEAPLYLANGPTELLGSDLSSPITLEDRDGTIVYFVRTPESAWHRVAVDHDTPGNRTIFLGPGGGVDVFVQGGTIRPELRLRLYRQMAAQFANAGGDPAVAVCALGDGGLGFIDGLTPGEYEVRAELGKSQLGVPVLGSKTFVVAAGTRSRVDLVIANAPSPHSPVRVSGDIFMPVPVEDSRAKLTLIPEDPLAREYSGMKMILLTDMKRDPDDPTKLAWDAGLLTPGQWKAEIRTLQWCDAWKVEPDISNTFRVDLSQLETTMLDIIDPNAGSILPVIKEIFYRRLGSGGCSLNTASIVPATSSGHFVALQAVTGTYRIEVEEAAGKHAVVENQLLPTPDGIVRIELSGTAYALLAVSARSRDTNVPLPVTWWRGIQVIRPDGAVVVPESSSFRGTGSSSHFIKAVFTMAAAGPIELQFPETRDFLQVLPIKVELVSGAIKEVVVELFPGN